MRKGKTIQLQTTIPDDIKTLNNASRRVLASVVEQNSREARTLFTPLLHLGMSQADLAHEFQVSEMTISTWLSGKRTMSLVHVGDVLSRLLTAYAHAKSTVIQRDIDQAITSWVHALETKKRSLACIAKHLAAIIEDICTQPHRSSACQELITEYARTFFDQAATLQRINDLIAIGREWNSLVEKRMEGTEPINLYVDNGKVRIESGQERAKPTKTSGKSKSGKNNVRNGKGA